MKDIHTRGIRFGNSLKDLTAVAETISKAVCTSSNDKRTKGHVFATFGLEEEPDTVHESIDEVLDGMTWRMMWRAKTDKGIMMAIRRLPVGSEPWRSAIRRFKNIIMNKHGFA